MAVISTGNRFPIEFPARHHIQATRLNGKVRAGKPKGPMKEATAPWMIAENTAARIVKTKHETELATKNIPPMAIEERTAL